MGLLSCALPSLAVLLLSLTSISASRADSSPLAFVSTNVPLGHRNSQCITSIWTSNHAPTTVGGGGSSARSIYQTAAARNTHHQSRFASTTTALALATSPEPIHTLFSVATFGPQTFWLLMILLPKADITKKIMGGFELVLLCCLVHFGIVIGSIATEGSGATAQLAEFNNVFDPSGDPQNAFMTMVTFPNFVAEEWSHVLTWDLFVGRYIWLDGLKRGIFTSHSVLLSNLIGPPGLLLHWLTCLLVGKEPWEKLVEDGEASALEQQSKD